MTLLLIALGFSITYAALQCFYIWHWKSLPDDDEGVLTDSLPGVSIIVVARNEENNISTTLSGLLHQQYPLHLVEIIFIDDHSDDQTLALAKLIVSDELTVLALSDFPSYIHPPAFKKSAIRLGVDKARFEHIVVTDADCIHPEHWLRHVMHSFVSHQAAFLTAPVLLQSGGKAIEKMQEMEQLVLMLITGAGIRSGLHDMANGANMAFTKHAFNMVKGYEGNMNYASGDDMFLIEKMRTFFPQQVLFAKSNRAAVITEGKQDWFALLKQRLRWAGKNKGLQKRKIEQIWSFIGMYHVVMLILIVLGILQWISIWPGLILLMLKWIFDYMVVRSAAVYFQRKDLLRYFVPLQMMYSYYILRLGWEMWRKKGDDWQRKKQ